PDEDQDLLGKLAHGDVAARTEVDGLAFDALNRTESHQTVDRVADECEIPGGIKMAEPDLGAAERLRDDRRNHRACRLTRTIGVEGTRNGDGKAERTPECLREHVGTDFRGGVR